jgi:predicted kinase
MPKLYLMCGLPFSGKTYAGRKIADIIEGKFLSYDEIWKELFDQTGKDTSWEELTAIIQGRIQDYLLQGENVVYDTLNDTVGNRNQLRDIAQSCGAPTFIVYMDTPMEIISARQKENEQSNQRHTVLEEKFKEAKERFEKPANERNIIVIKPDTGLATKFSK